MDPLLDGHLLPEDWGSWEKWKPAVTAWRASKFCAGKIRDCQEEDSPGVKRNIRHFMLLAIVLTLNR